MAVAQTPPLRSTDEFASADVGGSHESLICRFAEFVKMTALLPSSNERVRESADLCLAAFHAALQGSDQLDMILDKGRVSLGTTVIEVDYKPSLRWLVERLDRAGVFKLEFTSSLTAEALDAFCRQLQANCGNLRSSVMFSDLWPDEYDGLRPIERRFDGAFPVGGTPGDTITTKWKTASRQGQMLAEMLDSDEQLMARVEELQRIIEESSGPPDPNAPRKKVDLIGRLINLLPAEAMTDSDRMREMADELLERLTTALQSGTPISDDPAVDHLLHRVSRKFFFRPSEAEPRPRSLDFSSAPKKKANTPTTPAPPARTETEDRADAILEEISGITPPAKESHLLDQVTDELERLGVLLHFFVRLEDEGLVERLRGHITPSLAQAVPGRSALLQAHITQACERFDAALQRRQLHRLFDLLCDPTLKALADESRLFGVDNVVKVFPATFLSFLDTLDTDGAADLDALEKVCQGVGPARLSRAAGELTQEGGFARNGRAAKILRHPRSTLLPLYHVMMQSEPTTAPGVADALKALDLDSRLTAPLRLLPDTSEVPLDYLLLLTGERGRDGDAELTRAASSLIARFVTETDEERASARLDAIPLLGVLQCDEAKKALEALTSTRRRLLAPFEGEEFQKAAQRALSKYVQ